MGQAESTYMEGNATMQLGAVPTGAKDNTTTDAPISPNTTGQGNGTIKRMHSTARTHENAGNGASEFARNHRHYRAHKVLTIDRLSVKSFRSVDTPNFFCYFNFELNFGPLLLFSKIVALLSRAESALVRKAKLI